MQVHLELSHVMHATRATAVTAPGERGIQSTCGLVAMTSVQHAEGRQFDPGQVYAHYDTLGPLVMIEALIVCSRFSSDSYPLCRMCALYIKGHRIEHTWPGSNLRPAACGTDVIATRPQVRREYWKHNWLRSCI